MIVTMQVEQLSNSKKERKPKKIRDSYTLDDIYESYNNTISSSAKKGTWYEVDKKKFKAICRDFNIGLSNIVIDQGGEIELGYRMSLMRIQKRKIKRYNYKGLKINWQKTKEYGKWIFHLNEHTNGYRYHWYWFKKGMVIKNKSLWRFVPTRTNCRHLASILNNPYRTIDYLE